MKKVLSLTAIVMVTLTIISCKKDVPPVVPTPPAVEDTAVVLKIERLDVLPPHVVQVSSDDETKEIAVLRYSLTALYGNIDIDELPHRILTAGNLNQIVDVVTIKVGNEEMGTYAPRIGTNVIDVDDLDIKIRRNQTVIVTVFLDYEESDGNYLNGTTVQVELQHHLIDAEDSTGDNIDSTRIWGKATGEVFTLATRGVQVKKTWSDPVIESGSLLVYAKFDVTAFGGDAFIGKNTIVSDTITGIEGLCWILERDENPGVSITNGVSGTSVVTSPDAIEGSGVYKIQDGTTKHFDVKIILTAVPSPGLYALRFAGIQTFTNETQTEGRFYLDLLPHTSFQTESFRLN